MTSPQGRPIVVDLYAGVGGLSLGFEHAGFDVLAAVEFDPVHAAAHEFNFAYGSTLCADVREVTGESLRTQTSVQDADIDVVVGGPPCQGFSLMGRRALQDPRNELVAEFGRLVVELGPKYFVMENVAGLTVGKHRALLDEVIEYFGAHHYRVLLPYKVLEAAEYGVPQSRRRVFVVGARADQPLPLYPTPASRPRTPKGGVKSGFGPLGPSVMDALGDLPNADEYPELLDRDWAYAKFTDPSDYAAVLRGEKIDLRDKSHRRRHEADLLTSSTRTVHTALSISRFENTAPGTVEQVSRFLRLHPDGVSNTLRAGTASDRGAFTSPRPIHPVHPRCITVREAARLHGYPDWFRFHVTKWHGFRQIGNSVPPPLARAVAEQIAVALGAPGAPGMDVPTGDPSLLTLTQAEAADIYGVDRHVIPPRNKKIR